MGECNLTGDWFIPHGLIPSNAINLVTTYFDRLAGIASEQIRNMVSLNNGIVSVANNFPEIRPVSPRPLNINIEFGEFPETPFTEYIDNLIVQIQSLREQINQIQFPSLPSTPNFSFSEVLTLPNVPSEIPINIPTPPTISDISVPSPPDIVLSSEYPEIPDPPSISFPNAPVLSDIDIPPAYEIDFSYIENLFTAIDTYKARFSQLINDMVRIFNEDVERLRTSIPEKLNVDTILASLEIFYTGEYLEKYTPEILSQFEHTNNKAITDLINKSQNGFSLPPAFVLANVRDLEASFRDKRMELYHDYTKTKLSLYTDGLKFKYQFYVQLMTLVKEVEFKVFGALQDLWKIHADMYNKIFEMNKYLTEFELTVIKELLNYYRLMMEYYLTKYKYIELKLETNKQSLDIYKTQISAEISKLELYSKIIEALKTRVAIISERNQAEKLKIDVYTAVLQGIGLQTQIQKDRVTLYDALMKGELTKVELYKSRLQSYQALVSAKVSEFESKLKVTLGQADLYKTRVSAIATLYEAIKSQLTGYAQAMEGLSRPLSGIAQIFSSSMQAVVAKANLEAQASADEARINIANSELAMKEYETIMRLAIERSRNILESARSVMTVTGSICSSALAGIHVASQITASAHDSISESYSKAKTDSCSEQYIQSV